MKWRWVHLWTVTIPQWPINLYRCPRERKRVILLRKTQGVCGQLSQLLKCMLNFSFDWQLPNYCRVSEFWRFVFISCLFVSVISFLFSGIAGGVRGQSAPLTAKNLPKNKEKWEIGKKNKNGKRRKNQERKKKGKKQEGSFSPPLLTDRA